MKTESIADLGDRRELFVDTFMVGELKGTVQKLHKPQVREKALVFDKPWEGAFSGYVSTFKHQQTYYMYYRGWPYRNLRNPILHERGRQVTCLALSSDGIHWVRPELGLFQVNGTFKNNVVMAGDEVVCHNFAPFIDTRPGVPESERFKALAGTFKENQGIWAFVSEDGIHWRKSQDDVVLGAKQWPEKADPSSIPCFWSESENRYVAYLRTRRGPEDLHEYVRTRWIGRSTSQDFLNWTRVEQMEYEPVYTREEMIASNEGIDTTGWDHFATQGGGREQLYTNETQPYFRAPHIYLSFPSRYVWGAVTLSKEELEQYHMPYGYFSHSTSDGVFMTSRGGLTYDQLFREAFYTAGRDRASWTSKTCYPSNGIVPTGDDELSIYFGMRMAVYDDPCSAHMLRCTIRTDGFVSVNAPYEGGEFITKPFRFKGNRLELNYATSAAGGIQVEVQSAEGKPIAGFTVEDSEAVRGDEISRTVGWRGGSDVSALAGKPVRLRFRMKDADLYSMRFFDTAHQDT